MPKFFVLCAIAYCTLLARQTNGASFLFDATHAETAGNADWVIDEDSGVPQRIPTPAQENITASTVETYWTGANSAWGVELVKRGHHVETLPSGTPITYGDATNAQDLSHYDVFAVIEPNKQFTTAEKNAIVQYVQAGGRLFICADHTGSDRDNDGWDSPHIWNDLFSTNTVQVAPFGVTFNYDNISPTAETTDSASDDPLTQGSAGTVSGFRYANGASITIDPLKNPSVRAAVWTTSTHSNTNAMVAWGTFGAGKFVAVGDSSPIDDGTGASGNTLFDGWDDRNGDDGRLVINASLWLATSSTPQPPANDNFANAITLTGASVSASGTNVLATKEPGEPNHGGNAGGASVWWNWTAPASANVTVNTTGSNFDTLLGIYTGNTVSTLTPVTPIGSRPNGNTRLPASPVISVTTSSLQFAATAGVTYRIAVDGLNGETGTIQLSLTQQGQVTAGPTTVASWNFDAPPYANPLNADTGSGTIDFSGWGGVVTNFNGLNGTQALALQGTAGNGTYIQINLSMTGYSGLTVAFATRGTTTGYSSGTWSWSVNGGPFTTLPGVNTATTSTTFLNRSVDFTGVTALNNAASVRLRYTLDGSTGQQPNNRIENLVLSATAVPIVSIAATAPNAYEVGPISGTVTISSSIAAGTGGLPVSFQLSGTATAPGVSGMDYSLGGNSGPTTITIPAGATSASLNITPIDDSDPTEFDESAIVTLVSGANYYLGNSTNATVTIHDDTPYTQAWASQYEPAFSGANAQPNADPEGDGMTNFEEFAFDGDPLHSDLRILPVAGRIDLADPNDGNAIKTYPTITFRRRTDAPALIYLPELSTDLMTWTNNVQLLSTTPGPGPNVQTVVYRSTLPINGNGAVPAIFFHIRISVDTN
jgi:hypothetical protein